MTDGADTARAGRPAGLHVPPQVVPIERSASRAGLRAHGLVPAFADPCQDSGSFEEWLSCQESLDPLVLY